jgi:hypothetical protein
MYVQFYLIIYMTHSSNLSVVIVAEGRGLFVLLLFFRLKSGHSAA